MNQIHNIRCNYFYIFLIKFKIYLYFARMFIIFVKRINNEEKKMPRPQKDRLVHTPPLFSEFKPIGTGKNLLAPVTLTIDEYEALRLADFEALSHEEAAEDMEVSRSTFTRLVEKARHKIADFIINGKLLSIDGGNIHFRSKLV